MQKILLMASLLLVATVTKSAQAQDAPAQKLADEKRVDAGDDADFTFTLPEIAPGQQVRLATDARVDWSGFGGSTYWMNVAVNGTKLLEPSLINKAPSLMMRNGMDMKWFLLGDWNVIYSPDFSDRIKTEPYEYGVTTPDPYHFVWDITGLVKPGQNTVRFHQNKMLNQPTPLVLRGVTVEQGAPLAVPEGLAVRPAPQGELPIYVAGGAQKIPMQVELADDGRIRVAAAGRSFEVSSRTSLPAGAWTKTSPQAKWNQVGAQSKPVTWTGSGYSVSRRLEKRDDHVQVFDTISNTGKELVGVILENRLALPAPAKELFLAGRPAIGETSSRDQPAHPTALAVWPDYAVGLVAEDDIFRVHSRVFSEPNTIGLSDPNLGIAPGKSHTLEWSIYPQPAGDYWSVINAIRRNWGSNFQMKAAHYDANGSTSRRTPEEQRAYVTERDMAIAISTQTSFTAEEVKTIPAIAADPVLSSLPPGIPSWVSPLAEGTAIPMAKHWNETAERWIALNHSAYPPVQSLIYIDPNICSEPGAAEKYADSKVMDASGKHLVTPFYYPLYLYLPTLKSSYGKALMETVKFIVHDMNADGLYMDEFSSGSVPAYIYHTDWDGASVEIDPATHALQGQKSSSVLLQQPWRDMMIKYLRAHGKTIVANTNPATRTAVDWKVQFFSETNSYSSAIEAQLASPWALANHNADFSRASQAEMARNILDYGSLPCIYGWPDAPQHPDFPALMYPTTPEELRAGMVLGKERIVTNRSGRYGWRDGSAATVYVFDGVGNLVEEPDAKTVMEGKRNFIDLRMPSDNFAILVKK